jgi:hypothetical protein
MVLFPLLSLHPHSWMPVFFNQPVLQYFDAGSVPFVFTEALINPSPASSATISGYLLDCATTPCAAIAP